MPKHFSQQLSVSTKEKIQKNFLFPAYPLIFFLPADKKYSCPFRHMKPMQNKDQKKHEIQKRIPCKKLGGNNSPKTNNHLFLKSAYH